MKKQAIIIITLCLFILISSVDLLQAQEAGEDSTQHILKNIEFKHLTVEDGLSSNNVAAARQDTQGFLWIATTSGGLNKYDGIEFTHYVNDQNDPDSLSNNYTWRLYQDKQGNMWIITWGGGLSRFDSARDVFINYTHDENDSNSLSSDLVWGVLVDSNGELWVGTDAGLDKYVPEQKAFIHYRHAPNNPNSLSHNKTSMVLEGSGGVLWVSTYGGGLNKFDPGGNAFIHYRHKENDPRSLGNNFIWSMYEDEDGALWLGTEGGLDKFDPVTETFTHYRHDENDLQSLSGGLVTAIFQDSRGRLWVGTSGHGLNLYEPRTETFLRFQNDQDTPHSLADDTVWDVYEDATGTIWFATFNGLDRYDSARSRFTHYQHYPGNPNSLSAGSVQSFCRDREGMLWIGTRGGGLNQFAPLKQTFTHFLHDPNNPGSLSNNTVLDIVLAPDGALWIATGSGIDRFLPQKNLFTHYQHNPDDPSTLSHGTVWDIDLALDGSLWIGMYGGGLDRFDPFSRTFTHFMPVQGNSNSLVSEWVVVVLADSYGMIWVGTEGGLSRLDSRTETFTNFLPDNDDPYSLSDSTIHTIYQDEQGTIWIGTNHGLNRFNRKAEIFTIYGTNDGLAGNMVVSVISDNTGYLWIGTNNGISKFDPQQETFRNYDVRDGLQGNQFRRKAVHKSPEGELFFGGVNGFNTFFPEKVNDNPHIPSIVLTDFQLFNQSVGIGGDSPLQQHINFTEQITLSHDQSVFSFKFAALNYHYSEKNQYAYMMQGFDLDWTYVDSRRRFATYTNLDAGEYIFMVKGSNNDGIWNEQGTSTKIKILPPWWETVWFRFLFLAGLAGLILAGFQWRLRTVNAHKRQLEHEIKERKESEERFRSLTETTSDWVWQMDQNAVYTYVSPRVKELLGYEPDEIIGKTLFDFILPDEVKRITKFFTDVVESRKTIVGLETTNLHKDGREVVLETNGVPILDEEGNLLGYRGIDRDITERKRAEKFLRESESKFRSLFDFSPMAVALSKFETGKIIDVNDTFCKMFKYNKEEIISRTSTDVGFFTTQDRDKFKDAFDKTGEVNRLEMTLNPKHGPLIFTHMFAKVIHIVGEPFIITILHDITKEKHLESQLIQAQKMEAIGTLAGGIAHDFNNILGIIVGNTELMMNDVPEWNPTRYNLEEVRKASLRARDMVRQILSFSRQTKHEVKPIRISPIIEESLKLMRSSIPTTIEIRQNLSAHADTIHGDPTQINQILMNLCTNAAHAIQGGGGILTVGLKNIDLDEKDKTRYKDLTPGQYLALSVSDTGQGIEPKIIERIFDPYFTTKEVGEGTGMGLSVVHGIVKNHNGSIHVYSEPGKGTTFNVFLPLIESQPEHESTSLEPIPTGTERILFVDDELALADLGKRMLQSLGYDVTVRTNSIEALVTFRAQPDRFDLVVTDMTMPNMTGEDLCKELLQIRLDLPIILCTGFSEIITEDKARRLGIKAFLMKPLAMREIAETIRRIFDQTEQENAKSLH